MKKNHFYNISILLAIVCLLFVRYFEVNLDYRHTPHLIYIFSCIYEFLAIPGFYFFTGIYLTSLIVMHFKLKIPVLLYKIIKYFMVLAILLFAVFACANVLKVIDIHYIGFLSIYALVFIFFGGLCTLITNK